MERQRPKGLPVQAPCGLVILEGEASVGVKLLFWPCPSNNTISPQEDRLRWSVILEGEASTGVELLFWPCPSNNTISPQEDRLRMDVKREHSEIPSLLSATVWLIV